MVVAAAAGSGAAGAAGAAACHIAAVALVGFAVADAVVAAFRTAAVVISAERTRGMTKTRVAKQQAMQRDRLPGQQGRLQQELEAPFHLP